jgi:FkbM family methyltransferase
VSAIGKLKGVIPYGWRKGVLDLLQPDRPGIGPVLRRMERDLRVVFDIGANVGDVSCYLLHYFPRATVHAFEPCRETYDRLVANIDRAGLSDRFRPHRLGFFDEETEGTLHVATAHGANSMLPPGEEYLLLNPHIATVGTEQIPLMRLDDFVSRERIDHIDLVKIDVEGVELQVLQGGAETFSKKVDTVILEISFVRRQREDGEYLRLFQLLHNYGFAPAEIYDVAHAGSGPWKLAQFDCVFRRF